MNRMTESGRNIDAIVPQRRILHFQRSNDDEVDDNRPPEDDSEDDDGD